MNSPAPVPEPLTAQGLRPLLSCAVGLDLSQPRAAKEILDQRFPIQGEWVTRVHEAFRQGLAAGALCAKGNADIAFSRILRPGPDSLDFSVDAVNMRVPGPDHIHPRGEVDLCLAAEGDPRFDGQSEGWVVYGPGSRHVPTVTGGRMHIIYLLPGGAFELVK